MDKFLSDIPEDGSKDTTSKGKKTKFTRKNGKDKRYMKRDEIRYKTEFHEVDKNEHKPFDMHKQMDKENEEHKRATDKSDKKYAKGYSKASLVLEVERGLELTNRSQRPLTGRRAEAAAVNIDHFTEVKPLSDAAIMQVIDNFERVDINQDTTESTVAEYMVAQLDFNMTYCQSPSVFWSSMTANNGTPNYNSNYTSYTTKRFQQISQSMTNLVTRFALNDTYADAPALAIVGKFPSQDNNPILGKVSGLTLLVDSVNQGMLALVTSLKMNAVEQFTLKWLINNHPYFAQYLTVALANYRRKQYTTLLNEIQRSLELMPHDTQWVEDYSNLICNVSRDGTSAYDTATFNTTYIVCPQYQIALDNGQGLQFTPWPFNSDYLTEVTTSSNSYYYQSNTGIFIQNKALNFFQQLQTTKAQGGNLDAVVKQYVSSLFSSANELLAAVNNFNLMMVSFRSLVRLAQASGLTNLSRKHYAYDYDITLHYDPTIMTVIKHPELQITTGLSSNYQYGMSIAIERGRYDGVMLDATRHYSIVGEWTFYACSNTFSSGPNISLALQFQGYTSNYFNNVGNLQMYPVNSTYGYIDPIFQHPFCTVYSYLYVYDYTGNMQCITAAGATGGMIDSLSPSSNQKLPYTGYWTPYQYRLLNESTIYNNAVYLQSLRSISYKLGIFAVNEQSGTGEVSNLVVNNYTGMLPVVIRDVYPELLKYTLDTMAFMPDRVGSEAQKVLQTV